MKFQITELHGSCVFLLGGKNSISLVVRSISLPEGHHFDLDWVFDHQSSEVSEWPLGK